MRFPLWASVRNAESGSPDAFATSARDMSRFLSISRRAVADEGMSGISNGTGAGNVKTSRIKASSMASSIMALVAGLSENPSLRSRSARRYCKYPEIVRISFFAALARACRTVDDKRTDTVTIPVGVDFLPMLVNLSSAAHIIMRFRLMGNGSNGGVFPPRPARGPASKTPRR